MLQRLSSLAIAMIGFCLVLQAQPPKPGFTGIGTLGTHHYYISNAHNFFWPNAKADAVANGGHLVTITSLAEQTLLQNYVTSQVPRPAPWIGLFRNLVTNDASITYTGAPGPVVANQLPFSWVTGEPVTYTAWSNNFGLFQEPTGDNGCGKFVHLHYQDGMWNDLCNGIMNPALNGNNDFVGSNYILEVEAVVVPQNPCLVSIPDVKVLPNGVQPNTLYPPYGPASSLTLVALYSGGSGAIHFQWSRNGTPIANSDASTLTVTDGGNYCVRYWTATCPNGVTACKTITLVNIGCSKPKQGNQSKVYVCQVNNGNTHTICVDDSAIPGHLQQGDYLGQCTNGNRMAQDLTTGETVKDGKGQLSIQALNNPSRSDFTLQINRENNIKPVTITIVNEQGRVIETRTSVYNSSLILGSSFQPGIYFVTVQQGNSVQQIKLVKSH
jgi:hypothetical protein